MDVRSGGRQPPSRCIGKKPGGKEACGEARPYRRMGSNLPLFLRRERSGIQGGFRLEKTGGSSPLREGFQGWRRFTERGRAKTWRYPGGAKFLSAILRCWQLAQHLYAVERRHAL